MPRGRPRKYPIPQTITPTTETAEVKVTLNGVYAGPDGTARAGTVIDVNETKAREMIDNRSAKPYDASRDAKKPQGLTKSPNQFE